ncbi:MAG: amidohydrolase family protein [Candidatus Rokubacteria bacterium]|nr:amidohydrolase family protein [Candidatus Rokubacteria bacterium]
MLDLVIRGGRVVTPAGVGEWDVAVSGEKIVAIGDARALAGDVARVVDARGKIVIPGGIEPHAHAAFKFVYPWAQKAGHAAAGPDVMSRACAFGGTTTIVDFANWRPGKDLFDAIERRDALYKGQSSVDYTFHTVLVGMGTEGQTPQHTAQVPLKLIEQIPEVVRAGFTSVKVWTTNTTAGRPKQMTDFGHVWAIMQKLAEAGGVLAVHAEDEDIVMFMSRKLHEEGRVHMRYLPEAHPSVSEDLASRRVIRLVEWTGAAVYLMHVSAKEVVQALGEARGKGLPVYGETLHHYASFTRDVYETPEGPLYHTYPSLKQADDAESLWRGLVEGRLSTVATDAIVCGRDLKLGGDTIEDTVGGSPAIEERVGITFTECVAKRGMSLQRFAEVVSTNAAKILGLYPRKGVLAPGSDADIVLIDPSIRKRLSVSDLHAADHSVWAGTEIHGWPVTTILRGTILVEDGKFFGAQAGRLLGDRKTPAEVLSGAAC